MFLTLSNIQNGAYVPLNPAIDNREGQYEIALVEILYYGAWVNISAALGNNVFYYGPNEIVDPDGYYDICTLDEQIFAPQKLKLMLNPATGLASLSGIKKYIDLRSLGQTLGFIKYEYLAPSNTDASIAIADTFPKLVNYKELFVHLEGLSSAEKRHNQFPSTLLKAILVKKEGCNSGRAETFSTPQFKRLENGTLSGIVISVRDEHQMPVNLAYLSCVLEVRRCTTYG